MDWQKYDYARKSWYYYDPIKNVFVYDSGLTEPGPSQTVGYAHGLLRPPEHNADTFHGTGTGTVR